MLVLIRGVPGSGKTTMAKTRYKDHVHYEADMYFTTHDGVYKFDHKHLKHAHQWCQLSVRRSLFHNENVVVSNTFIRLWELEPYIRMANEFQVDFNIIRLTTYYGSIHNIFDDAIKRMVNTIEEYPEEIVI